MPEFPDLVSREWEWFQVARRGRQHNGVAFLPLTSAELDAFFRLERVRPQVWQIELLRTLDSIELAERAKQVKKPAPKGKRSGR